MYFDVIVLGSGPGGYVASIRSAQLGMKTAIVEKECLGGVGLNWGYIPTKTLLNSAKTLQIIKKNENLFGIHNQIKIDFGKIISNSRNVVNKMRERITFLMKKNGIHVIHGKAKLKNGKKIEILKNQKKIEECYASHIIIATGSRSKIEEKFQKDKIIGYKEAISLSLLPKKMIVMGSDSIGLEFSYFYHSMGTEVTIIELFPKLLPNGDEDISDQLKIYFDQIGIKNYTSSFIKEINSSKKGILAEIQTPIKNITLEADIALSTIGTPIPNVWDIGLEEIGIHTNKKGFIIVDDKYRTNIDGYYAIGDVIEGPSFAHVASNEAISCVENIKGMNPQKIDYNNIPKCIYCYPEISSVGYTEKQAKEKGYKIKVGKFSFRNLGKSICDNNTEGFVKVIFDDKYDEWLGCHMIGNNVSEIISEVVVARKLEANNYEIMGCIHPHPSLSESILESIFHAYEKSIHL
ncbi:MAG: dihydrolipoyl dehydrogenase [Flavobacteriales bacterium]|uniref:dihydrolipoyl dehydrogenase n=1 Tax=Blattabacterium sp. (Mastotermes darwiniensis) TaxID=39768 RepID=UPI00059B1BDB|nr:dihydrolipoyl dehydrogenase [Blattabacterium sp. (Mastotermes darwiniensis)]MDR1804773.1 dihydrolipoyl dehydrogenase [Flavobacteriales bacterium]